MPLIEETARALSNVSATAAESILDTLDTKYMESWQAEAGLKTYVGAAAFENDSGYGSRVLAEYRKLKQVAGGKSVPTVTPPTQQVAKATPVEPKVEAVPHGNEVIAGL